MLRGGWCTSERVTSTAAATSRSRSRPRQRRPARPARTASTTPATPARPGRCTGERRPHAGCGGHHRRRAALPERVEGPHGVPRVPALLSRRDPLPRLEQRLVSARTANTGKVLWSFRVPVGEITRRARPSPGTSFRRRSKQERLRARHSRTGQRSGAPHVRRDRVVARLRPRPRLHERHRRPRSRPRHGHGQGAVDVLDLRAGEARPGARRRAAVLRRLRGRHVLRATPRRASSSGGTRRTGSRPGSRRAASTRRPAVAYGRVYIGNTDDKVYAFEASDGQIAWTYTMPYWAYGSPAWRPGASSRRRRTGRSPRSRRAPGQLLWRHKLPYKTTASPTVIGSLVYVADRGAARASTAHLTAFDAVTGRRRLVVQRREATRP